MWQYSNKGKVSGISGDVDLNISYRDFASIIKKSRLNNL
jgi:GH25 family lysozyme M1 (1,4-beta-N-acetylmuramidase)